MIQKEVLKTLIKDCEKSAFSVTAKYSLDEAIKLIKDTSCNNHFFRLLSNLDDSLKKISNTRKIEYENRSTFIRSFSEKLRKEKINHFFFKGAAYSINYYKNLQDRPYSDFDILIDIKNMDSFYNFLDTERIRHRSNIKYIHRIGYTRTAIEVTNSKINVPFDFHHRLISKFHNRECPLSRFGLDNVEIKNGLCLPPVEVLIAVTIYHCLKQGSFNLKIINVVDIARLLNINFDRDLLFSFLEKTGNTQNFLKVEDLINNLSNNINSKNDDALITQIFQHEVKNKKINFSRNMFITQIFHLVDPVPYINYSGGSHDINKYLELFRMKFLRGKTRLG